MFVASIALTLGMLPAEKVLPVAPVKGPAAVVRPVAQPVLPVNPMVPPPPGGPVVLPGRAAAPGGAVPGRGVGDSTPVGAASPAAGEVAVLEAVKLRSTDEALLNFFRRRTPPAVERPVIEALTKQLGSSNSDEADEAQSELIAIGQAAVPVLRQMANNVDEGASGRARVCLQAIIGPTAPDLVIQAARLLASRRVPGATGVLLGYLPYADTEEVFTEVESALSRVGIRDGKPDPALLEALKDPVPLRRGTAAQVLCRAGGPAVYAAVRPLLADKKPSVRLEAALGLAKVYDAEAIPVLISLLADLPPRSRQQAEDFLSELAGEWAVRGPTGNDRLSRRLRQEVWAAWWKQTDGEKLLEEIRSRTLPEEERARIQSLVDALGEGAAEVRQSAARDLLALGSKAVPLLRRTAALNQSKSAPYAQELLQAIEQEAPSPLPAAAPRLLGLRRPEGMTAALLAYLPFAESEEVSAQIAEVLAAGVLAGRIDEALIKGLDDKLAIRRAAAATALCKGRAREHLPAVRKLLTDKEPEVRLRVAQGLLELGEKEAIPVLISLLGDLPFDQVWEVEEILTQLAGDKSPTETISSDPESRKKGLAAWSDWWKENGKTVQLTGQELGKRELGFLVVVENWNPMRGRGRVLEVDPTGKVRWEVANLFWPYDVQLLRGGNILVIEQQNRVTERDRTGKVVWEKPYPNIFHAERLNNGNTFLACRNQLLEVNKEGKAVFTHSYNSGTILAARRFRDGSMAYVSYSGQYVRLDRTGKQVKTLNLPWQGFSVNGAEVLPGDRVLVSVSNFNKVIEYNAEGKQVWEASVRVPLIPYRLPNGNTLVPSNSNTAITEIDRRGKVVKEMKDLSYRPYRVYTR